jgi:hypothetical protein
MMRANEGSLTISAGGARLGLLPLIREDVLSLVLFSVPGLVGLVAITALVLIGGILLLLWSVLSFFLCLRAYIWMEERGRRQRVLALALAGLPRLASRVVVLYSSPVEKSEEVSEVFALYRQAQQSLEEGKDPGLAGELIERGVYFADELLMGSPGEMLAEGNRWSERKEL